MVFVKLLMKQYRLDDGTALDEITMKLSKLKLDKIQCETIIKEI